VKIQTNIIIACIIFLLGGFLGYKIGSVTHPVKPGVVDVKPVVTIVTQNVEVPVWRTRYITKVVTVNNSTTTTIVITTQNAVEVATNYQRDVIHFENDTLNVTIAPYEIVGGIPPKTISMDASLYDRSWKMQIHNAYTIKQKPKLDDFPLVVDFAYSVNLSKMSVGLSKYILTIPLINTPVYLGLSYTLN